MKKTKVYYFQSAPNLAGAQKSLSRLVTSKPLQSYEPTVFISTQGWLSHFCEERGVRHFIVKAPGPRKLRSRILDNKQYASRIADIILADANGAGVILHGNDLLEGTPVVNVARRLGAYSVLTLRTPGMERSDFEKYHCGQVDQIAVVGTDLYRRVKDWARHSPVKLVPNGLGHEEFHPLKLDRHKRPEKIVVLGASQPRKGWSDLLQALEMLKPERLGVTPEFVFLGADYGVDMRAFFDRHHPSRRFECRHLPRTPAFVETLRHHDLAIQPSRSECHGMAALEAIAAGLPLISTNTGDVDQVIEKSWLCEVENPGSLAKVLTEILANWEQHSEACYSAQQNVRENINIDITAASYSQIYEKLTS